MPGADRKAVDEANMRATLVRALYGTPSTILLAMIAGTAMVAIAYWLTADPFIGALAVAKLALTGFRYASHVRFFAKATAENTHLDEVIALAGAWLTAGLLGLFAAYAVHHYPMQPVATLAIVQAVGYAAGVSARNSSRPIITKVQVSIASLPLIAALFATMNTAYLAIGSYLVVIVMVTISSADIIHRIFVSNFMKTRDLERLAISDTVTPLSNRRGFVDQLSRRLDAGLSVHIVSIDADNFKAINDTFGHDVGDEVLREIANRIGTLLKEGDFAARIGGDEFMVLTDRASQDVHHMAEALVRLFDEPVVAKHAMLSVSVSVGLANATGESPETGLKRCDLAVYQAKSEGKNRWVSYSPELSAAYEERMALERDLRLAIANGEIDLHFQPVYSPRSQTTILCEALMRWSHPVRGPISPAVFIPIAEQTGLIKALGCFAIERSLEQASDWPDSVSVSINVSPRQFARNYDLIGIFRDAIARYNFDPKRIVLEFTESTLADDADHVIASLTELREMGIKIALDDFGTGYSSLSYLTSLPIDKIKIDRSLMRDVAASTRSQALLNAIMAISQDLGLNVIVEGVETLEQLRAIEKHDVDGIQGFLFARPMPADEVKRVLDFGASVSAIDPGSLTKSLRKHFKAA